MGVFNGYKIVRLSDFCHVIFYMRHSIGVSVKFEEFLFKIQYLNPAVASKECSVAFRIYRIGQVTKHQ